jgi:glucokinase
MADGPVLAIDIGGTKMAAGLVSLDGAVLWSARRPTTPGPGPEDVWAGLAALLSTVPASPAPSLCGVGCGGPMAAGGVEVSPLNIPGWRGFPLLARLAEATALPTWVDNDAKALARAEGWRGAGVGRSSYLSMVVSTGVGGGIVLDGRLLDGRTGNAGHIGHMVVVSEGRSCECGGRGCLEAEASGTAIEAVTGRPAAAATADVVERTGRLVGLAVASVSNLLDLDLATVAGSVALGFGVPFFQAAQEEIDRRARLSFSRGCRIVPTQLGTDAPLLGAAAVALHGAAAP